MVCITGAECTREGERQGMRSRGLGPDHAGLTVHEEEFKFRSKGTGKPLEGFRQVTGKLQLTLTIALQGYEEEEAGNASGDFTLA